MLVKKLNWKDWTPKKKLKERGFRVGPDKKMRRMWLGREIVVVGLPPLTEEGTQKYNPS